jgi:hypothetical protein
MLARRKQGDVGPNQGELEPGAGSTVAIYRRPGISSLGGRWIAKKSSHTSSLLGGKTRASRRNVAWIWSPALRIVAVEAISLGRTVFPFTSHEQSLSTAVS